MGTENMFLNTAGLWTLQFVTGDKPGAETDMKQPKIFSESGWGQSSIELVVLYGLTVVVATIVLDMHWVIAMAAAPFMMLALLLALMVFVQVLWILVVGIDRIGAAIGVRKSPLS